MIVHLFHPFPSLSHYLEEFIKLRNVWDAMKKPSPTRKSKLFGGIKWRSQEKNSDLSLRLKFEKDIGNWEDGRGTAHIHINMYISV